MIVKTASAQLCLKLPSLTRFYVGVSYIPSTGKTMSVLPLQDSADKKTHRGYRQSDRADTQMGHPTRVSADSPSFKGRGGILFCRRASSKKQQDVNQLTKDAPKDQTF